MPLEKRLLRFVCISGLLATAYVAPAQTKGKAYSFGISTGAWVYQGDLTPLPVGAVNTPGGFLGLQAGRALRSGVTVGIGLLHGRLRADEASYSSPEYRAMRAFRFSSRLSELSAGITWEPFGTRERPRGLSPFASASLGMAAVNVSRDYSGLDIAYFFPDGDGSFPGLAQDAATSPRHAVPVAALGAGLVWRMGGRWAVQFRSAYRHTRTDLLDGFSASVNPRSRDQYMEHSIGLLLLTGGRHSLDCPKPRF